MNKNFDFFENPELNAPYNCDIIVCASRPKGTKAIPHESYDAVIGRVQLLNASYIPIMTIGTSAKGCEVQI